jgi:hypothetical protein
MDTSKDSDHEDHPATFKIAKAMIEAGELKADLEEMGGRMELAVVARILPEEGAEEKPEGGVLSLSTLGGKEHLQLLMEGTQYFAHMIDYPLEMMVLQKTEPEQG